MSASGGARWPSKRGSGNNGHGPRNVTSGNGGNSGAGGGAHGGGSHRSRAGAGTNRGGFIAGNGSGSVPNNICFDFQNSGSCRFGSACRFIHSMAGSKGFGGGNAGGSGSSNNSKSNVCFDFLNGSCRFGSSCKFVHTAAGNSSCANSTNYSSNNSSQKAMNIQDSSRFVKQLKNTHQNQIVKAIVNAGSLWTKCWECAGSSFSSDAVEILLQTFAKIPYSEGSIVTPPPIYAFNSAMKKFLKETGKKGAADSILAAETTLNVTRKMLSFEWEDKVVVKDVLSQVLEEAASHLQRRNPDHRDALRRIDEVLDSLEKPWTIKEKLRAEIPHSETEKEGDSNIVPYHHYSNWKTASVKWLLYGPTFSPSTNPKMQGPTSKSQGVYKSREHYFDTMQRLMIAMAFSEGHAALAPKCWEKGGGQYCGGTLIQIPDHNGGEPRSGEDKKGVQLMCRGMNCKNAPRYVCKIQSHGRGLCALCASHEKDQLLGPTGSTHVYNGHIDRVDASGKLYIRNFASRKPPMDETGTTKRQIHWRSTKRLAVPNLVGIVRLGDSSCVPSNATGDLLVYRALRLDDRIHWGEVCPHGSQTYEAQQRQQGNICVNLASRAIFQPNECPDVESEFKENDVIAIIDCQSFVPEYIPVIRAIEKQEQELLPFDDGILLNLDSNLRADLTNTVLGANAQNKAATEGEFQKCIIEQFGCGSIYHDDDKTVTKLPLPLIDKLVRDMIACSTILPLREIRQNPDLSGRLQTELCQLLDRATLDFGQLVNFVDALRNPVHITQGPPGTGKSYLGVQLVHALGIIRNYWVQQNCSVGSPPILVLSYKNHAIDEFLSDLLKVMGPSLAGSSKYNNRFGSHFRGSNAQLVRMGNPGDANLAPYSERALAQRADPNVGIKEREVHDLQDLRHACQRAQRSALLFRSYQSDMFDTSLALDPDTLSKRQKAAAYEATEVLYAAIVRSHYLKTIISMETGNMLQPLLDIGGVLNRDKPDDPKFKLLQLKGHSLGNDFMNKSLTNLFEGIQHYIISDTFYNDPHEVLFMFLMGQRPKPCCKFEEVNATGKVVQCEQIADWHNVPLCHDHRCALELALENSRCTSAIFKTGGLYCQEHVCCYEGCDRSRMFRHKVGEDNLVKELYCEDHACFHCVRVGRAPALEALDEPPRNVCDEHQLCSVVDCKNLALKGEDYCEQHIGNRCKFKSCNAWAIARDVPYCRHHEKEVIKSASNGSFSITPADTTLTDSSRTPRRQCIGTNKKKKPCKSTAMAGSDFCEAHAQKDFGFKAEQRSHKEELKLLECDQNILSEQKAHETKEQDVIPQDAPTLETEEELAESFQDNFVELEYGPPPDLDNVDLGRYDNADEVNEGEGTQHIREIFDIESGDEGENEEDSFQECRGEEEELFHECENATITSGIGALLTEPKDWNWSLSLDDRWAACQAFMHTQYEELQRIQDLIKHELPVARKRLHEAESRARAKVFENKTVIGGTIVGCIARLEQIRATRPFAIIVEEASEVMEPLLFACLCESTVKFQMIGDHLQLQPSLMDKFDYTRINKVNVSMFERLICAPDDHRVPSGVLSVQRRMRKDICDLTREYYTDIVTIEDHPVCHTKVLQGQASLGSFWQGREVPGVASHLYLWTHNGIQGRADVGVSKVNKEEAQMCVNLAYFLVKCGVAKSSIAILTPYKGQLMLIRKLLLSDNTKGRLLTLDSTSPDQTRLSTVDRFQGDEADVVIASLVVDEKSRTQFVKLQNRMIVLLSRARIGCFILGNIGYFEGNRHNGGRDAKHWMRTFEILEKPPKLSDNSEESVTVDAALVPREMQVLSKKISPSSMSPAKVMIPLSHAHFTKARVGPTFPLCCPQHPLLSNFNAKSAKDLDLGFCQIACEEKLSCSHSCGLKCHWPIMTHNRKCAVEMDSPCSKHPSKLPCFNVFRNSNANPLDSIHAAMESYRCPVTVSVVLPCSHVEEMPCWHEDDIAQSKRQYPSCDRKAPSTYIHPDCGHELEVSCSQLELYLSDPSVVKPCADMVEYYPPNCNHVKTVKCYLDKAYCTGRSKYVCPEKLTINLPRCGHEATVTCAKNVLLEQWSLEPSECKAEVGVVREGVSYGKQDYNCTHPSKFVRLCGHEENVTCNKAFEIALNKNYGPCLVRVPAVHPHCGHSCTVTCQDAIVLKSIDKLTQKPVTEVNETDPPYPQNLPRGVGRCTEMITLRRNCGHTEEVKCCVARLTKSRCNIEVEVRSPLCGHTITLPCWRRQSVQAWRPWSDEVEEHLAKTSSLPFEAKLRTESIVLPDKEILDLLKSCSKHTEAFKFCGHQYMERCCELVTIISDGGKSKKGTSCSEQVTRELPNCGHKVTVACKTWQKFTEGKTHIPCNETVEQPCWNANNCRSYAVCVPCLDSADEVVFCCNRRIAWTCSAGLHTHQLPVCTKGYPSSCPECEADTIASLISAIRTHSTTDVSLPHLRKSIFCKIQNIVPIDDCVRNISNKHSIEGDCQIKRFFTALANSLGKFQSFQSRANRDPFQQPQFRPVLIPMFYVIPQKKHGNVHFLDGFANIKNFISAETLSGIAIHHLSRDNMLSLANETRGSARKSLLVGYLFCLNPKVGCTMPTGKTKMNLVKTWQDAEGHDCVEFKPKKGRLLNQIIVWDPAPLYALHLIGPLDADGMRKFAEDIDQCCSANSSIVETSNHSIFAAPGSGLQKLVCGTTCSQRSLDKLSSNDESQARDDLSVNKPDSCTAASLRGSWAESLSFLRFTSEQMETKRESSIFQLHSYSSRTSEYTIPESIEHDLTQKMTLVNSNCDNVYGGKKMLEQNIKLCEKQWAKLIKPESQPFFTTYQLLLALEIASLHDYDRAMEELTKYCSAFHKFHTSSKSFLVAHPLLLLAFARIGLPNLPSSSKDSRQLESGQILIDFARVASPQMIELLLSKSEQETIDRLLHSSEARELSFSNPTNKSSLTSPFDVWESLKDTDKLKSEAMEELLLMTGLRRVKQTAVELFKQGLVLSRMDGETRKLNTPSLNYVFYGNPGTGKTTVARLFSRILLDAGLRQNSNFEESSGQSLKDSGLDDFKKKVVGAMNGVFFIDEAYMLDPVGDKFKGAPIANEILLLAENERERLSFILAGYEDEMNDKLFSFNSGFKSRFTEVFFEDFDEEELLTVWNTQRAKKKWHESNDQLGRVVVRRLMKSKGRKGFGNARAVRQKLEEACARAMAREDFDGTNLELQMEDAVGENPVNNDKLKSVLKEIEQMTGWNKVKERVHNLVQVCGQNYERELSGQEPIPIFLNRLFLGNPGTGKTTCAKQYGRVLKELGFLSNGEVVFKTAGDLGGQVVGESKQKTLNLIDNCRGKVLVIDEAYGLNDNLYGKQALDAMVEKVQGTEADDIAVLLLGYEEQMLEMLDKQNPGLRRRFAPDQAFYFEDYTNNELNKILTSYCNEKNYKPTLEFCERALKKLDMQRKSEFHFGNAGSVQNLLKEAVALASKRQILDGIIRLEAEDIELPGEIDDSTDPFADLDLLYGMEHIKTQLIKLKSQFDLADEEGDARPKIGHFVFTGAPGTGKTTVARCVGKMLFRCGLLSRPNVLETSGLNLTGQYVGSTKNIVQEHLDKAKGGVLFIDEAYELGRGTYGSEACSTLVEAMTNEEKYGGLVIVMAGYQADMQSMLDTNQGLKSRFNRFIEFPDWEVTDCIAYFHDLVKEKNFTLQKIGHAVSYLEKGFSKLKPLKGWGNARDVVKLFEGTLENRAMRLIQDRTNNDGVTEKIITDNDVSLSIKAMVDARMGSSATKRREQTNSDPYAELNTLYRMEQVQEKLQQLRNTYLIAQLDGEDPPPLGHFIFVGSPGTGKTTVARVMSKILFDLDLITRNHVEETTGLEMQGQYVGQTKKVVEVLLDKAKGGILFIDEAYTLSQGSFGTEACDTLVAAMTNPQYAGVVVVIAGYPKDIDDMLRSNAGLKSRFTHTMTFPDWDTMDCVNCFKTKALSFKYELPEYASTMLESGFKKLKSIDGFGNARDVDAIWKTAKRYRADRIASSGKLKDGKKSFDVDDIRQALDELIKARTLADGKEHLRKSDNSLKQLYQPSPFQVEENRSSLDCDWVDEWAGNWADDELIDSREKNVAKQDAPELSKEQDDMEQTRESQGARDPGVSDADWLELEEAKEAEKRHIEQCKAEEEERIRAEAEFQAQLRAKQLAEEAYRKKMEDLQRQRHIEQCKAEEEERIRAEAEFQARLRAKQLAEEAYRKKMEDLQRQRELAAEMQRRKEMIKQKLRAIGNCPAGYVWHKVCGGWRCAGGSHFVSDVELNKLFGYDVM